MMKKFVCVLAALMLLTACALAYIVGMIWYMVLYKKYMR